MKVFDNLRTRTKLILTIGFILALLLLVAGVGYFSLGRVNENTKIIYEDRLLPIEHLGTVREMIYKFRGDVWKYMLIAEERAAIRKDIAADTTAIDDEIKKYNDTKLDAKEQASLADFDKTWHEYQAAADEILVWVDKGDTQSAIKSVSTGGRAAVARGALDTITKDLIDYNQTNAEEMKKQSDDAYKQISLLLIVVSLLALAFGVVLTILIVNSLNKPLQIMAGALNNLSQGNLNRDIPQEVKQQIFNRNDEIGAAGKGLAAAEVYQIEMVEVAQRVANGDLTVEIKPKSDKDELGQAFAKMLDSLRKAVGEVARNASELNSASSQLASAAAQSTEATNQIANTITQVAKGAGQQNESIMNTSTSVEQMSRAINGVAKGAQEQASAVAQASTLMNQLSKTVEGIRHGADEQNRQMQMAQETRDGMVTAIGAVSEAADLVAKETETSAQSATEGQAIAVETAKGMQKVRTATEALGERVGELGKRSGQIGAIVETIEDIASQTNLLALNAAIEAARAGEHGKGFAVVADEVRKLAERSTIATKEIGEMIRAIQGGAKETVEAMQKAGDDVRTAAELTTQAREAFEEIARGTQASNKRVKDIRQAILAMQSAATQLEKAINSASSVASRNTQAAEEMAVLNNRMVESLDGVGAVVEENTAATEEMAASSSEVSHAVESIAAISEENSAAVEEVSASAEEMSAQVEEVTASAQSLSEMAVNLQKVVNQFKLNSK
jgi:methyl-accepting chemotaxis protein